MVGADKPDRYAEMVPLIEGWAGDASRRVRESAAETGGFRDIAWVTSNCSLSVAHAVIPATADDDLGETADALADLGFDRSDRRYVMWVDANVYCGIAYVSGLYSRVDEGCFGYAELHELVHNLGGVSLSAPNTSGGWHCTDEWDDLCYSDSPLRPAMRLLCPPAHAALLDCNHDDYFSTSPRAGTFLSNAPGANTADSPFLVEADGAPPVHLPPIVAGYRGPRFRVQADNADDDLCAYARPYTGGARRRLFCIGYAGARDADVTGALLEVADERRRARLELVATDRGFMRTFGFRVLRDGVVVLDERAGVVGATSSDRPLGEPDPGTGWPAFYSASVQVQLNQAPTATVTVSPSSPVAGQATVLRATATDADGSIAGTDWDLDEDGAYDDASGNPITPAFPEGSHRVAARVTDDLGASVRASLVVTARAAPVTPVADPEPAPAVAVPNGSAPTSPTTSTPAAADACRTERTRLAGLQRTLSRDRRTLRARGRSLRSEYRRVRRLGGSARLARYRRHRRAYERLQRSVTQMQRRHDRARDALEACK